MALYTVVAWEYDEHSDSTEGFDIGGANDSLEATFLARNEVDENPAVSCVTVHNSLDEIIYIIDTISGRSDYIARRDGLLVKDRKEALSILLSKPGKAYSPYGC